MKRMLASAALLAVLSACWKVSDLSDATPLIMPAPRSAGAILRNESVAFRTVLLGQGAVIELAGLNCTLSGPGGRLKFKSPALINIPIQARKPPSYKMSCGYLLGGATRRQETTLTPLAPQIVPTTESGPTYSDRLGLAFSQK